MFIPDPSAVVETRWLVTYPDRPCDIAHSQASAAYLMSHGGTAVHSQTIAHLPNGHSEWMPGGDWR